MKVSFAIIFLASIIFGGTFPTILRAESVSSQGLSIQKRFDKYWKSLLMHGGESEKAIEKSRHSAGPGYRELFAPYQNASAVRAVNNRDLKLLFRAAHLAAFYTFEIKYSKDMGLDLSEMERRSIASKPDYRMMYKELAYTGRFFTARKFYVTHPHLGEPSLPAYRNEVPNSKAGIPTALVVSLIKREMTRRPINLDAPAQVVILVDPLCHFSAHFLHALQSHPKLRSILQRHAIWITPPDGMLNFDTLQRWDRAHPSQHINIMYKPKEWSMIKIMRVPMFYFLRYGKLITTVYGWPKNGNIQKLDVALQKIGLIK